MNRALQEKMQSDGKHRWYLQIQKHNMPACYVSGFANTKMQSDGKHRWYLQIQKHNMPAEEQHFLQPLQKPALKSQRLLPGSSHCGLHQKDDRVLYPGSSGC